VLHNGLSVKEHNEVESAALRQASFLCERKEAEAATAAVQLSEWQWTLGSGTLSPPSHRPVPNYSMGWSQGGSHTDVIEQG
jgi:hypothetical protein